VVSHDRDFLDGLVDKVYEFRDKKIRTHLGGIAEFLRSRRIESLRELEKKESPAVKGQVDKSATASSASTGSASVLSNSAGSASVVSNSTGSASVVSTSSGSAAAAPEKVTPPLNSKERYLEKKETERVYRRLRRQAEESEAEITLLEKEIAEMNARLASGDSAVVSDPAFYSSYEEKKKNLDVLMQRWETAHNELETFTSDYMNGDAGI
jgi:ATP-binding cassette subfamily F protein 3